MNHENLGWTNLKFSCKLTFFTATLHKAFLFMLGPIMKKEILADGIHFQPCGRQVLHRLFPLHYLKLKPTKNDQALTVLNGDIIKNKKVEVVPADSKMSSHIPTLPGATLIHSYLKKYTKNFKESKLCSQHTILCCQDTF